jgi:hypothetical protein
LSDGFFQQFPESNKKWMKKYMKGKTKERERKKAFESVEKSVFRKMRGES